MLVLISILGMAVGVGGLAVAAYLGRRDKTEAEAQRDSAGALFTSLAAQVSHERERSWDWPLWKDYRVPDEAPADGQKGERSNG